MAGLQDVGSVERYRRISFDKVAGFWSYQVNVLSN
jgi:hypothetical protein